MAKNVKGAFQASIEHLVLQKTIRVILLRSAVGKTHVLRSGLVMDYTTSYFPVIVLGYPLDSKRSYGPLPDTLCPGACFFPPFGVTWSIWTNHRPRYVSFWCPRQGSHLSFQFLPTGLHGLCFGYCFSGPLPLRSLTNGPLFRVHFRESLVIRLYSEIDHIHLSIEAQCVTTLLPLGDCHTYQRCKCPTI